MSILILDDIDMLMGKWTSKKSGLDMRISSILLSLIDQLKDAYIIGLTSRLHAIDPSFLRSGRLDDLKEITIKLPEQRFAILQIVTKSSIFIHTKH
jgi:ATP-dependent 26S proteasome regulatory subunit